MSRQMTAHERQSPMGQISGPLVQYLFDDLIFDDATQRFPEEVRNYFHVIAQDDMLQDLGIMNVDAMTYSELLQLGDIIGNVCRGIPGYQLNALPSRTMSQCDGDGKCCICMNHYAVKDVVTTLHCKHEFHRDCIRKWLEGQPNCPLCKMDIKEALEGEVNHSTEETQAETCSGDVAVSSHDVQVAQGNQSLA